MHPLIRRFTISNKRLIQLSLLGLLCLSSFPAIAASFNDGWNALLARDFKAAEKIFSELTSHNDPEGTFGLGVLHQFGYGLNQDYAAALTLYLKAAEANYPPAIHNIGFLYQKGLGVEKNIATAISWYKKSADLGFSSSQNDLAWILSGGIAGAPIDYAYAFQLYEQAAKAKLPQAMAGLGWCYEAGKGVAVNLPKAVEWYNKAADLGDSTAQYNLGAMYHDGRGVKQDYGTALMLYQYAAQDGLAKAMYSIGSIYAHGLGVQADYVTAYAYVKSAGILGETLGATDLSWFEERLTAAQLARAQKMVVEITQKK